MNKYIYFLLIAFCFTISSCDLFTEPAVKYNPTEQVLSNFNAVIVDYDSVKFSSHFDIYLDSKSVKEIAFTVQGDSGFVELQRIEPTYIKTADQYRLDFEYAVGPEIKREAGLSSSSMIENYNINFYLENGDSIIVEKQFEHYRYPYGDNVFIHFTADDLPNYDIKCNTIYVSWYDFDIRGGGNLFYMLSSSGGANIYILDILQNTIQTLAHTSFTLINTQQSGRVEKTPEVLSSPAIWIAVQDSIIYVVDDNYKDGLGFGMGINKVNIVQETLEWYIHQSSLDSLAGFSGYPYELNISGVESNNDYLMVSVRHFTDTNFESEKTTVLIFDHAGNFIKSIEWRKSSDIEIYKNILYSVSWSGKEIVRYDLNIDKFLESKPAPLGLIGLGMEVTGDRLYYTNWGAMLSIPLKDFLDE